MLDPLGDYSALYDAGYEQQIALEHNHPDAWRELGMIYLSQNRYSEAIDAFQSALELDSSQAILYYSLGLGLTALEDFSAAISAYEQAINLAPDWGDAYHQLGQVWLELGEFEQAEKYYKTAIGLNPKNSDFYLDFGNLLVAKQQIKNAIHLYETALEFDPENFQLCYQLGMAFNLVQDAVNSCFYWGCAAYYQAEYTQAIPYYQDYLNTQTQDIEIYLKLADCYQKIEEYQLAIDLYQLASQKIENSPEIDLAWIQTLQEMGETAAAINLAENALEKFPDDWVLKFAHQRILPIVYNHGSEVEDYRQRFSDLLTELITEIDLSKAEKNPSLLKAISTHTNFYLQYQGYNDLELQKQYGKLLHQIMGANFPQWIQPLCINHYPPHHKIKIGYVSSFFQWHTVGIVFLGWLKHHNHQDFEIFCYYTGKEEDELTKKYNFYSDYFYQNKGELIEIFKKIEADKLDILVFLDVGMCPLTMQIASLRLASIQCAAWGHPVTTGLPTIDYFISADLLEPSNAQDHYSETLVRLPNLGIYYEKIALPDLQKTRSEFGLKNNTVVYLSCQSLFKYLPQYDYIFVEIAKQVPLSQFVFVSHWNAGITERFRQRLIRAFSQEGLESKDYCIILPRLNQSDYLELNLIADIGLDTIQFTGFLTTLDSLACYLPIVTCEGEFMRSRQTAGILKRIGVTETIAKNEREYIKIAVELGLNSVWRQEIINKIKKNQWILYEDLNGIQSLEDFYRECLTVNQ